MQELKELRLGGVRNLEEAEEFEIQTRKRAAESAPSSKGAMDRSQRYTARTGTDDSSVMSQVLVPICNDLLQEQFPKSGTAKDGKERGGGGGGDTPPLPPPFFWQYVKCSLTYVVELGSPSSPPPF